MKLGEMRDAAEALDGQGLIEVAVDEEQDPAEALGKWGEPAYLTLQTRSGSPIRIDRDGSHPHRYATYFHCQTGVDAGSPKCARSD